MRYFKKTVRLVAFALGLIALLKASSVLFNTKPISSASGMEEISATCIEDEKKNTVDVLILGDSEAYSAVSPMEIWKNAGYTAYNCGTAAQTLDYSEALLTRTLEKQSPKIVFLETNEIYRKVSSKGVVETTLGDYFPVFKNHDQWKSLSLPESVRKKRFGWMYLHKGYCYKRKTVPAKTTDYMKPTDKAKRVPEINVSYIKRLKSICHKNGARLVLFSTPSTVNWNYEKHNGIRQLADELNCDYLDLNLDLHKVNINWKKDSRDAGDHMNHRGAVKVSRYLTEYLKSVKLLKDHRNDKSYISWNKSQKKYDADVGDV